MTAPTPSRDRCRGSFAVSSLVLAVASAGAIFALVARAHRSYVSLPLIPAPTRLRLIDVGAPQVTEIAAVVLWVLGASSAIWAWRRASPRRLMAQILVSSLLVNSRIYVGDPGIFEMLWQGICFGLGIAAPFLLLRYTRGRPHWDRVKTGSRFVLDVSATAFVTLFLVNFSPRQ